MKRSRINREIRARSGTLEGLRISPAIIRRVGTGRWRQAGRGDRRVVDCRLGWDVTTLAPGISIGSGAVLFTIRNGNIRAMNLGTPYAGKGDHP